MDPQPATERKQVLSDIEQSIQNALALFNSKDLGGGIDQLYVIDDPIVSLHDPKKQDPVNKYETSNSCKPEITKNKSPPETVVETDGNQQFYDALPFTDIKMSHESIALPFLDNPIQNTIEEMQRVLNAKTDIFSPKTQSQPQHQLSPSHQHQQQSQPSPTQLQLSEPSPEELLNLYSQDLGIALSPNLSPRGDVERSFNENDFSRTKQTKKEKKNTKKAKQPKLSKEKKTETKKGKSIRSEVMTSQDIKMRELMNIYGCGDKMKKPKSDSTLGSKSGVSRNASMRKLPSVKNISSKASSIAVSRKTKKLKYKFTNDLDINFSEGDLAPLEKSTRLSTKRKAKQKTGNIKPIKKPNLKRKLVAKTSADDVELKLSKSYQTSTRNRNYETHKSKNNPKDFDDNQKNQRKQTNQKPSNRKQKDYINHRKALSVNDAEGFSKGDNITILDAIPNMKDHVTKSKSSFPEIQSEKLSSFLCKQSQIIDAEKNQNTLHKKVSEERRLNKQVSLKDGIHYHNHKVENREMISDFGNEALLDQPSQFHYTLPTQSSRSKEVERFLNGHYQHLPFVIGQSTNKSHNLWVNIQEALSLIKHNIPQTIEIHSSHDKDSERPLSVLSKLTTKSCKKPHQCPALMSDGLYDIPETSAEVEDGVKAWEDHPDCIQANLDPNFSRPRCSCLPQTTLSYKKVLRQIFGGGEDTSIDLNRAREEIVDHGGDTYTAELRKVLITFTQEFEDLNNKYEELLSDPNSSKEELQQLEMYLETKEEEIREIIARINEVKDLNDRSRGELQVRGSSLEPYKSTTSVQLWQTLRRVQQFKADILSKPSGRHTSRISCAKSSY